MPRISPAVTLSEAHRSQLEQWVSARGTPQQVALRCRIVLAAAEGETNLQIAVARAVDVKTVALWRGRFIDSGPEGLWEIAPGRGRKATYSARKIKTIVQATTSAARWNDPVELPHDGKSRRWTARSRACR